jgi:hypothetical protein
MSINIISYNTIFPYYGEGSYESPYVWDYYTGSPSQFVEFTCNQRGKVYIGGINNNILDLYNPNGLYDNIITKVGNSSEKLEDGPFLKFYSNSNSSSTYIIVLPYLIINSVYTAQGTFTPLSIWFEPESETTTTTTSGPVTTTTTTPEPKVFIHVGNITVSDDYCGRYKLTSTGDTDYLRVYGKRIYLINYPSTPRTYDLTVCAADLANRFTPVCDTFSLDIDYCEFTTLNINPLP